MTKLSLSYLRRLIAEAGGGGGVWGSITGTLSSQSDLQSALNAKEGSISAGTTSQYWRGDKSWQTLDKSAVGLGNVDNTADVNKSVASAAILTTARKINSVSFDGSADVNVNNQVAIYQALGSVIKAVPFWCSDTAPPSIGGTTLSNQLLRIVALYLNKGDTITGVKWIQNIAGVYTANNYNGWGLYSYSGGTLTLVASTTDDGNIWKGTSGTLQTKAFSSTYVAAGGLYFLGSLYCRSAQTTAPALPSANYSPIGAYNTLDFTNSAALMTTISGQTALPATQAMSGLTSSTQYIHAMLY